MNVLINSVHTARHGLLCNSLNMLVAAARFRPAGERYGKRPYGVVRSRNKVIVGEPVVGGYDTI